jgi:hypothetical protein
MAEANATKSSKEKGAEHVERRPRELPRPSTASGPYSEILTLQRNAGNRAVSNLLQSQVDSSFPLGGLIQRKFASCDTSDDPSVKCGDEEKSRPRDKGLGAIQTKLTVSRPGDRYEREADRVADLIMSQPDNSFRGLTSAPATVQRKCTTCESGNSPCSTCDEEERISRVAVAGHLPPIQRQVDVSRKEQHGAPGHTPEVAPEVAANIGSMRGSGKPLPQASRSFFEQRFGYNFGDVRVHADTRAAETARRLQARAFTVGQDVVFGAGQYAPETSQGKRLLAHELTHVAQQSRLSSLSAGSAEMIPGYINRYPATQLQMAPQPMIQRDKIDYKQLSWDDFKKPAPKKATFDGETFSDFHDPDFDALMPATFETEDTAEPCKVGKKELTKFKAKAGIDPENINVKAYMWQDKSWKKAWTTEPKAREDKCKKTLVKDCEAEFTKQFKKVEKDRAKEVKLCHKSFDDARKQVTKDCQAVQADCNKAFDEQAASYDMNVGDTTITAANKKECKSVLLPQCISETMKGVSHSVTFDDEEAKAESKAECKVAFSKKFEELSKKQITWTGKMAGEEAEVTSREECSKSFLQECATRLSDAASAALLKHEQGHFDITNVMADKTQEALRTLAESFDQEATGCGEGAATKNAKKKAASLIKQLKAKYKSQRAALNKTQSKYDTETNHGKKEDEQSTWEGNLSQGLPD